MPEPTYIPGALYVGGPLFARSAAGPANAAAQVVNIRRRFTTAEVNAGQTILAAVAGIKWRIIDCILVSVGGAASGATSVRVAGTQATSVVQLITAAVAALTQGAAAKPGVANVTPLTDGAAFAPCDVNTAITLNSNGTLATSTHIDVILTVTGETV